MLQSRIDYAFVGDSLIKNHVLRRVEINAGVVSDHSIVHVELSVFGDQKGRGLFRFDNTRLEDTDLVERVRQEIRKANCNVGLYADVHPIGLKLEMFCSEIRVKGNCSPSPTCDFI